jgi:hypothetical protein
MKWYSHVLFLAPPLLLWAIHGLGCQEYVTFSSDACRRANEFLGTDLYWDLIVPEMILLYGWIFFIAPIGMFLYVRQALRWLRARKQRFSHHTETS